MGPGRWTAWVRAVPDTYVSCIVAGADRPAIDVSAARRDTFTALALSPKCASEFPRTMRDSQSSGPKASRPITSSHTARMLS